MMCPIRSPLQFIQTTNEAEPKLRMVFGKGKVQRRKTPSRRCYVQSMRSYQAEP
jgi:hypothetical protein